MKRLIIGGLATLAAVFGMTVINSGPVSAHHATVTGQTTCLVDGWKVDWIADASNNRNVWKVAESGWSGATWISVQTNRTKTTFHGFGDASASQTVNVTWAYGTAQDPTNKYGPESDSKTVNRPNDCTPPTTTTTTTTTLPPTTTTTVPTTTTTVPATTTTVPATTSTVVATTTTTPATTMPDTTVPETSVAVTTTVPETTTPPDQPTTIPTPPPDVTLPETGADTAAEFGPWALLALCGGAFLVMLARRRVT